MNERPTRGAEDSGQGTGDRIWLVEGPGIVLPSPEHSALVDGIRVSDLETTRQQRRGQEGGCGARPNKTMPRL